MIPPQKKKKKGWQNVILNGWKWDSLPETWGHQCGHGAGHNGT